MAQAITHGKEIHLVLLKRNIFSIAQDGIHVQFFFA